MAPCLLDWFRIETYELENQVFILISMGLEESL
jgi:hypothetical protein